MSNFSYYSKIILNKMNTIENLLGQKVMFQEVLPEFESNFWKAHDADDIRGMMVLNETLNKIIDDINVGNSFVFSRATRGDKQLDR